jgi:alanyl-tRNA synthetase
MTVRRYYTDSYARAFTARVVHAGEANGVPAAVLDETFFYPTSGGQPHDTGRLGSAAVVDVMIREPDGAVLHLLDAALPEGLVEGNLDWSRRFDHMQQHTGQHVLSQAFLRLVEAPTIGFHLGTESVSIDLGVPELREARVADAEALANQVAAGNAPVRAWFPSEEELRSLALRKMPEVTGPLRVVAIGDFDFSACGGTHVASTSEIGLIAIQKIERLKRGLRVEFLCGGRAAADYRRKHVILQDLSASLTCSSDEISESVARLQSSLQETRRELGVLKERELDAEADRLAGSGALQGTRRIVRGAWTSRAVEELKGLAHRLTAQPAVVALLGIAGERAQILFGRSEDVAVDLKPAFEATLARLGGGRGGGARFLQGAAGPADLPALIAALEAAEEQLRGVPE